MSALFGFCGGPNKKHLSRMQEVLAHRGESVETHSSDQLSVGIWKALGQSTLPVRGCLKTSMA